MSKTKVPLTPDEARHFKTQCPKCHGLRTGIDMMLTKGRDDIKFRCQTCGHVWRLPWSELDREPLLPASWSEPQRKVGGRSAPSQDGREGSDMAKVKGKGKKKASKKGSKKKGAVKKGGKKKAAGERDPRIPAVGTVLKATYKSKEYAAKVTADGFEFDGEQFTSISKVGKTITGRETNGYLFFGLTG